MTTKKNKTLVFLLLSLLTTIPLFAQETIVVGQVVNKFDQSPLESVSVYFKGTNNVATTNEEGYFLIRNKGNEKKLIFSLIGFKKVTIKVKPGENLGTQIEMEEKINLLEEVLVLPGANPAKELIKNARKNRKANDVRITQKSTEQRVVFLSKKGNRWENNRIFSHLKNGNLSIHDSTLLAPIFLEEAKFKKTGEKKEIISENKFNTTATTQQAIKSLLKGLNTHLNFYNNSVSVLNKNFISPLANIGGSFYRYYLTDSISRPDGKEYVLKFRSKNTKNLAFNGELLIDSATYALTKITAELPLRANLNYIHNLQLNQVFKKIDDFWIPERETSSWNLTYQLLKDSITSPELLIRKSTDYSLTDFTVESDTSRFANTDYNRAQLEAKLSSIKKTPLFKVANYIADGILTGYLKAGKIDIGPVINIARLTKSEGFRIGLPFKTNETLWKNFMIGGYGAYGFKDKEWKYGGEVQWKLPIESTRIILGTNYVNDKRRTDYNYHDYLWRQDPLSTGDENMASTIFSFKIRHRLSKREEFSIFIKNDWNDDVESNWIYRDVKYFPNDLLPLTTVSGKEYSLLRTQSLNHTTRISFNEGVVNEHFQRLYLKNNQPAIYATVEAGRYYLGENNGNYGRLVGNILHQNQFMLGEWRYMIEAGKVFGDVPYPLLKFPYGKENSGYNRFEFAMMNNQEFVSDTYAILLTELITNGIIFNNIPLIKHLNLREIASFKMAYGTLSTKHNNILALPTSSSAFNKPYSEVSVGFCNLLGLLSVQSIWRLSEREKPNVKSWGIKVSLLVSM